MDLFEHQAKELFAEYGIPVPRGIVAHTVEEARSAAEQLTGRVVVKAQVKTGGRGKAGGVKVADDAADAEQKATQILGMDIKGHTVHKVLIEEASAIAEEYYFSFLLDRANRTFLAICSAAGGMDIEEVAHSAPDKVAKIPVSPWTGSTAPRPVRSPRRAVCRRRHSTAPPSSSRSSGAPSSTRTPPWSRSTR